MKIYSLFFSVSIATLLWSCHDCFASEHVINPLRQDSFGKLQAEQKSYECLTAEMQAIVLARENQRRLTLVNIAMKINDKTLINKKELRAIAEQILEVSQDQVLHETVNSVIKTLRQGNCCCGVSEKTIIGCRKQLSGAFYPYFEEQTRLAGSVQPPVAATAVGFEEVSFK